MLFRSNRGPTARLVRQAVGEIIPPQTLVRKGRQQAAAAESTGVKPLDAALEAVKNLRFFIRDGN